MHFFRDLTADAVSPTRARERREIWECIGCKHRWVSDEPVPRHCIQCGVTGGYAPLELEFGGHASDEVAPLHTGPKVPDWSPIFPAGIPLGRSIVLRGRPGAGKSRASYRLASQIGSAIVLCIEMGQVLSVDTATRAGAKLERLRWYDDVDEGLADLEVYDPDAVVVDSVQLLRRARACIVDRLRTWAEDFDRNVLFVSQLGKHGSSRHGEDDDFDCDLVVDILATKTDEGRRRAIHGDDDKQSPCADGTAHVRVAKTRICAPLGFDVRIVA